MLENLTEDNKRLLEQLEEDGKFDLTESDHSTGSIDPTDATVNRPKWRAKIFEAAMSRLVADQFYEVISMDKSIEPNPTFTFGLDDGVTTTEVEEGGLIKGATIEFGKQTLTAVKHALKASFTQESIEDAMAAGIDAKARAIDSISKLISREIDLRLNRLLDSGAATVIYWSKDVPADSSLREHYNTLNNTLVDADTAIEAEDYKANGILVHPSEKGILRKTEDYYYARQGEYPEFKNVDGEAAGIPVFVSTNRDKGHIVMAERKTQGTYGIYKPFHTMPAQYDPDYDKWLYNGRERSAMRTTVGEAIALVLVTQEFTNETLVDISAETGNDNHYKFANWRIDPSATFTVTDDNGDVVADATVDYWGGEYTDGDGNVIEEASIILNGAPVGNVVAESYTAVKK